MATSNAAQQPSGYDNHIKNIAIVGASGTVGSHIVTSLLAKKTFTITAISRAESKATFADGIKVAHINYNDPSTIVTALKGQDVLIITLSVFATKDTSAKLFRAAAEAGVSWVLPNELGMYNTEEAQNETIGDYKSKDRVLVDSLGLSWIGVTCGFWYEYSLSGGFYGIDIKKREVVFLDGGTENLNTSTLAQCGRGVANLLSLPISPKDGDDKSVTLSAYRNRMIYISSFAVSQRDMFDSLKRVTGTADSDWTISSVPAKQRYAEAKEQMKAGSREAFGRVLYTRYFFPGEHAGLFEKSHGLENEKLGLPEEDLDEATKAAVRLLESGYWNKKW